jgi:hypothetical protein
MDEGTVVNIVDNVAVVSIGEWGVGQPDNENHIIPETTTDQVRGATLDRQTGYTSKETSGRPQDFERVCY